MSMRQGRRTFLRRAIGTAGAGLVGPLFAVCAPGPTAPSAAAVATASATVAAITRVSYAYASSNGLHVVATVGGEKPDLLHKLGLEFDLLTTTNSPNAVTALVGGLVNVAAVTPDSAWPAHDKAPDINQLFAVADTPTVRRTC